ncbi:hypothetical protein sS8_2798 [Methylocaldum marinum]|uniref:Uncharacterized protein n=1 Tax=Methylocaldum marinum TaxID=1432792 RepID=A0A250KST2_9GAMM|nr:hypothetical protein sS8_2798 [Methylocaldum marinum]
MRIDNKNPLLIEEGTVLRHVRRMASIHGASPANAQPYVSFGWPSCRKHAVLAGGKRVLRKVGQHVGEKAARLPSG